MVDRGQDEVVRLGYILSGKGIEVSFTSVEMEDRRHGRINCTLPLLFSTHIAFFL